MCDYKKKHFHKTGMAMPTCVLFHIVILHSLTSWDKGCKVDGPGNLFWPWTGNFWPTSNFSNHFCVQYELASEWVLGVPSAGLEDS